MAGENLSSRIDRTGQNIPLPVGGMAPTRVRRTSRRTWTWVHAGRTVAVAGALCASAGGALLALPPEVSASLVGGRVEIGSMVLTEIRTDPATGVVVYGGDASYALLERRDGTARAVAAWVSSGRRSEATCDLRGAGFRLVETCTFTTGRSTLTSVDILDAAAGSAWQRTYSDGARVTVAVPPNGAAIPVPFAVGR